MAGAGVVKILKNMKALKYTITLASAIALVTAINASASETTTAPNPYFAALSAAPAAELPAQAADFVSKADAKTLRQATVDVVKAAVSLNPASASTIVGSIAKASPSMAAVAAATAITLVPDQAAAIARAAAIAAPTQAAQIVEAMCRQLPGVYQQVADAVAGVVPSANKAILAAVAQAIPSMKDSLNNVVASYNGNVPSVSSVLDQAKPSADVAVAASQLPVSTFSGPSLGGPTISVPYTPTPVVNNSVDPTSGSQVPKGGVTYSSP